MTPTVAQHVKIYKRSSPDSEIPTDECKLEMHLCYKPSDHPEGQRARHWLEDGHVETKDNVNAEGSPGTLAPDLRTGIIEELVGKK